MSSFRKLYWIVAVALAAGTIGFGWIGWSSEGCQFWLDRTGDAASLPLDVKLYRTLLAFFAASPDCEEVNKALRIHRLLGLFTAIVAILSIIAALFHKVLKRLLAAFRWKPQVIVGASEFAADYVTRFGPATIFDTEEALAATTIEVNRFWTLRVPDPMGPRVATGASLGYRPRRIVFGDRDTITNVERARVWLMEVPARRRKDTEVVLRIEDAAVARDLALLSPAFAHATLISRSETIARSLVTGIAPTALAIVRRQERVHVMLFGLGSVNLAVAEEVALRCHHPDLAPPCITIVDCDVGRAQSRLRAERPDLLNPEFASASPPLIHWLEIDGLECTTEDLARALAAREVELSITAIVVSAGQDTINAGIAMRLRRLQRDRLILKAPILMRSDAETSIAPRPLADLTGDVTPFGGRVLDADDIVLEDLHQSLAKSVHDLWLGASDGSGMPWEDMPTAARRSSYRAAMFAVDLLVAAGLTPATRSAKLRVEADAGQAILDDPALMHRLAKTEHERWIAERRSEGYTLVHGPRDDEKKRHPGLVPFDGLSPDQAAMARANVRAILDTGLKHHRASRQAPAWRRLVRVGVIGPLVAQEDALDLLANRFATLIDAEDLREAIFEIVTPNAPGVDREGTVHLQEVVRKKTGRKARILMLEAASPHVIDLIAADHIAGVGDVTDSLLASLAEQQSRMTSAADSVQRIDCRPVGCSDADLLADRSRYIETVRTIQTQVIGLVDFLAIVGKDGDGSLSAEALEKARNASKPVI